MRDDDEACGVTVPRLRALLAPLVGAPRDYAALGRGLPRGKDSTMTLLRCDARRVELPGRGAAVRFDLVGDRFVRRQVILTMVRLTMVTLTMVILTTVTLLYYSV